VRAGTSCGSQKVTSALQQIFLFDYFVSDGEHPRRRLALPTLNVGGGGPILPIQ
jgi:hypothetical protein